MVTSHCAEMIGLEDELESEQTNSTSTINKILIETDALNIDSSIPPIRTGLSSSPATEALILPKSVTSMLLQNVTSSTFHLEKKGFIKYRMCENRCFFPRSTGGRNDPLKSPFTPHGWIESRAIRIIFIAGI